MVQETPLWEHQPGQAVLSCKRCWLSMNRLWVSQRVAILHCSAFVLDLTSLSDGRWHGIVSQIILFPSQVTFGQSILSQECKGNQNRDYYQRGSMLLWEARPCGCGLFVCLVWGTWTHFEIWAEKAIECSELYGPFCGSLEDRNAVKNMDCIDLTCEVSEGMKELG